MTPNDLDAIARLARLDLTDDERDRLQKDLTDVLEYMSEIQNIDTTGLEPLFRPVAIDDPLRDDVAVAGLPHETVAALAQETQDGFLKVPRTVDAD
jgi:aspartyl-tRNA(Asn)/glutamyl-tRNA(Gln) amidotransferase subunit C